MIGRLRKAFVSDWLSEKKIITQSGQRVTETKIEKSGRVRERSRR